MKEIIKILINASGLVISLMNALLVTSTFLIITQYGQVWYGEPNPFILYSELSIAAFSVIFVSYSLISFIMEQNKKFLGKKQKR